MWLKFILTLFYSPLFVLSLPASLQLNSFGKEYTKGLSDAVSENRLRDSTNLEHNPRSSRTRRNARRRREFLWATRTIPYEISYQLRRSKAVILDALYEFENKTCIRFIKRTKYHKMWIQFKSGSGCSSNVGKLHSVAGAEAIILDYSCLYKGTIVHEVMHSLGFWHEHSRPDRNKYIEILWENMAKVNEINFEKFDRSEVDTLGIQYDVESVMHYGNYAFSKNGQPTLKSIKEPKKKLGNWNGLSKLDVVKINAYYGCGTTKTSMTDWSSWSPCNKACWKLRQRFCISSDKTKCKRINKHGVETQRATCKRSECFAPINGEWTRWSSWTSQCSVTCGYGTQTRIRKCSDPRPKYGGKFCKGKRIDIKKCKNRPCNIGTDDCDFDDGQCHWKNSVSNSYFKWIRTSGQTPSEYTGPNQDHTTGKGYYMYAESSFPASHGSKARLISKTLNPGKNAVAKCMSFWYHLFGLYIGGLKVKLKNVKTGYEWSLWQVNGNQGNKWKQAYITIESVTEYKVVFEALHPGSYLSDFAIDDVFFKDGKCELSSPTNQCKNTLPSGNALGLETGIIKNNNVTATSYKGVNYVARYARLNNRRAWCSHPKRIFSPQYVKIDLGRKVKLTAIATQGNNALKSWVTKYRVYYSPNGKYWKLVSEMRKIKIFQGNHNSDGVVRNKLPKPVIARYVGLNPISWSGSDICLRIELYGCPETTINS